jgi:cellulose synthase/poly-beta-1,6-N-acetylglucosamine synthase-like glycosyltransferase
MTTTELCFWVAVACVVYAYLAYPVLMLLLARLRGRPVCRSGSSLPSVSILVAAYNEERTIRRRVRELADLIAASGIEGEVLVISDGSTDRTAELAWAAAPGVARVLEMPTNRGKGVALTAGRRAARHPILVLADARQRWAPDALTRLLENFADPAVGAAGGDLIVETASGVLAGVGLYWRYEKWLRRQESAVHSTVGVTGAICAVRRDLFPSIPSGTLLDDVYWPLHVAMQGYRVIHDPRAQAFDRLPEKARDEFRRKVRTLSGNFQLLARLPGALLPWRNPIWFQLVSHKVLRLVVPWALLVALVSSAVLGDPIYGLAFWGQVILYAVGLVAVPLGGRLRLRFASALGSFLVLNSAAWLAFWVWVSGRAGDSWRKVKYEKAPSGPDAAWSSLPSPPANEAMA